MACYLVREVATNFAVVGDVKSVQFVQPVGDGFAVPAEREVLWVVRDVVVVILLLRLLLAQLVVGIVPLEVSARLLPLHVLLRRRPLLAEQLGELEDLRLHRRDFPRPFPVSALFPTLSAGAAFVLGKQARVQLTDVLACLVKCSSQSGGPSLKRRVVPRSIEEVFSPNREGFVQKFI